MSSEFRVQRRDTTNSRGLTLIEIIIAAGIAAIVGSLLVVIIVNSLGLYSHQSSKVKTGLDINDALLQIRLSVKQARAVVVSYIDGQTTYTTGANQLVFKVASIDSLGNIIDDTFDFFVIFTDDNILHLKTFSDSASSRQSTDRILSTSLESLTFQYFNSANPPLEVAPENAKRVTISLSLKQKIGTSFESIIATTEADLRND